MNIVGSALDDRVELAAGGMAEFSVELVLQHREFGDSIVGKVHHRSGDVLAVVVGRFDGEIIVARPLAADRRTGTCSNASRARYTGAEEREVQVAAGRVCRGRQIRCQPSAVNIRNLSGGGIEKNGRSRNVNRCLGGCQAEAEVGRGGGAEDHLYLLSGISESGSGSCYGIGSYQEIIKAIVALRVGRGCTLDARGDILGYYLRFGHDRATRVEDGPNEVPIGNLRESAGCQQCRYQKQSAAEP